MSSTRTTALLHYCTERGAIITDRGSGSRTLTPHEFSTRGLCIALFQDYCTYYKLAIAKRTCLRGSKRKRVRNTGAQHASPVV